MKIDPFELPTEFTEGSVEEEEIEQSNEDECPSCNNTPSLYGPTDGCHDPQGCGIYDDTDEEEDDYLDEEEDEEMQELDFGD